MSKKNTTESPAETGDENDTAESASSPDEAEVAQDWTPESADTSFASISPEKEVPPATALRKRGSGLLTWLALFLSVAALGAFAFDSLRDRSTAGAMSDNDASIATLSASVRANRDALAALEQSVSTLDGRAGAKDKCAAAPAGRIASPYIECRSYRVIAAGNLDGCPGCVAVGRS
jgi:hypothetical protein